MPTAGRVPSLDELVASAGSISEATLTKGKEAVQNLQGKAREYGDLYIKAMEKVVAKGSDYLDTELARLIKLVESGNISPDKRVLFLLKQNVLRALKGRQRGGSVPTPLPLKLGNPAASRLLLPSS